MPLAENLECEITRIPQFDDLNRDKGGFLERGFNEAMRLAFMNLEKSFYGWETAKHALQRFSIKVDEINTSHDEKKILIVSHGCVLSLYFAKVQGKMDEIYGRWLKLDFCSWGIMENGRLIKDIIKK